MTLNFSIEESIISQWTFQVNAFIEYGKCFGYTFIITKLSSILYNYKYQDSVSMKNIFKQKQNLYIQMV